MELKDFIVNTILDIQDALIEIEEKSNQKYLVATKGAHLNPHGDIEFDVAVGHEKEKSGAGKVKGGISVLGGELDGKIRASDQDSSRIRFILKLKEVHDLKKSFR